MVLGRDFIVSNYPRLPDRALPRPSQTRENPPREGSVSCCPVRLSPSFLPSRRRRRPFPSDHPPTPCTEPLGPHCPEPGAQVPGQGAAVPSQRHRPVSWGGVCRRGGQGGAAARAGAAPAAFVVPERRLAVRPNGWGGHVVTGSCVLGGRRLHPGPLAPAGHVGPLRFQVSEMYGLGSQRQMMPRRLSKYVYNMCF